MGEATVELSGLAEITEGLPEGWKAGGNAFWAVPGAQLPEIAVDPAKPAPTRARIILRSENARIKVIRIWGADTLVQVGRDSMLLDATINCGDGARVVLDDRLNVAWAAWIDARNGGSIHVGEDGLWSSQVRIATDDMHSILDVGTNRRLNKRGSTIVVGRHVWLGMDSIVLPGVTIGDDSIVGIRAVVAASVPTNAVAVGVPARIVRRGVTWSHEDQAGSDPGAISRDDGDGWSGNVVPERRPWFRRLAFGKHRRP